MAAGDDEAADAAFPFFSVGLANSFGNTDLIDRAVDADNVLLFPRLVMTGSVEHGKEFMVAAMCIAL